MDLVIQAVKSDLALVLETGKYMLGSLFLLAVVVKYLDMLNNKTNWGALILWLTLGFLILEHYVWIMDTARTIVTSLNERINPQQNYVVQYAQMSTNMQQQFEQNTQQSLVSQATNFLFGKFTLHNLIINISFIFYAIISKVMMAIRYCVVAIMYKVGPILIPLILFDSTRRIIKGWFTSYMSVLCWPILWHIVLATAVALSASIGATGQGIEQFAALNFSVCFVLMFTPMIITGIIAGIGAGGAAALAGVMSSRMVVNTIQRAGRAGRHFINKATPVSKQHYQNPQTNMPQRPTPTVMKGRFKEALVDTRK